MKYIAVILFCKLLQPLLNKKCSMELSDTRAFMKYILIRQLAAAVIAFFFAVGSLQYDLPMIAFGAVFAICMTVCTYAGIAAMQSAAMVLVSFFEMAGLLLPCIAGIFLFSEPLTVGHVIGLMGCLISAWLLTGGKNVRISAKGWVLLVACLLSNGGIMLTQKLLSYLLPNGSVRAFHFWGFLFSAVCSLVLCWTTGQKNETEAKISKKLYVYGIVLSAAMLTISMLSTLASKAIPAVVLFPLVNGGGLLLCTGISSIVYKEKLTVKMIAGLILGTLALMVINLS